MHRSAGFQPASADGNIRNAAGTAGPGPGKLVLRAGLYDQLLAEAHAAFPHECCGLIEGVRAGRQIEAVRFHSARNLAERTDRFEIDPMEQFRLLRLLQNTQREIVGCYHSHPNGRPTPSARDHEGAAEENFVWLIASLANAGATDCAAFLFVGRTFEMLKLTVR